MLVARGLSFGLAVLPTAPAAAEAGNSIGDATPYTLGATVRGSLTTTDGVNFHKFVLRSSGKVDLSFGVSPGHRPLLAVTMRFDRAWPGPEWFEAIRGFAVSTATRIVTLAQVARDAPRAVRLAEQLGGDYLMPESMRHDDLDAHVRSVYRQALAVVSDRAHGLIIGATEGAYPLGSGSDPQKISRLLASVGLGGLVGRYDEIDELARRFDSHVSTLAPAVDSARIALAGLTDRIQAEMGAVA